MKKQIIWSLAVIAVFAAFIAIYVGVVNANRAEKCREYEQLLGGHSYSGFDSITTDGHGKVSYRYEMDLNADGTCLIHFKATRSGDTSRFPKNGTTEFDLTGMNWYVRYSSGGYEVYIAGGDWNWQDWTSATMSRSISILDFEDGDLLLKTTRNKHYEFYFRKQTD